MATLPDLSVFGKSPSGLSGRSSVDYTGTVAPGRQLIESAGRSGAGLAALGKGVEQASERALTYMEETKAKEDKAALAEAQTTALLNKSNLDESLKNETDADHILKTYPDAYKTAFETSGSALSPEARRQYDLWSATHQQAGFLNANERAHNLTMSAGRVRFYEDMDALQKSSVTADIKDTGSFIANAKERVQAAVDRGYITPEQGFKDLHEWSSGVRVGKIKQLPPEERLSVLGGVKPGTVAATDLSIADKGILNAIAGPESSGKYDVRYTPNGGATFVGFDKHPGIREEIPGRADGKGSDAAGRYQFLGSTWKPIAEQLGLKDFSPENQDRAALHLAKTTYQKITGRSLDDDIKRNGGLTEDMLNVLSTNTKGGQWEGFNTPKGRAKAIAAYKATVSGKPDVGHAFEIADHPLVTDMTIAQRDSLANDAANDWARENYEKQQHIAAYKANITQRIADDRASILKTGQPLNDLSLADVEQAYGPERAKQLDADRQVQKTFFSHTQDFDSISTPELAARLDILRPSEADAGKPGFKERVDLYKATEADVKARIKERNLDPAASADRIPAVQEAKRKVDLGGDETAMRELSRARMQAFDVLKIPDSRRIPMTRQEAKDLAAPLLDALPGKERAAIEPLVKKIHSIYGNEMDEQILGFVLETARIDQDTAQAASKVFKKLGFGQQPTKAEIQAVDTSKVTGAMKGAAAGSNEAPKVYPIPSREDIRILANNPTPQMVAIFNEHYGPKSGERVMGAIAKMLPNNGNKE